MKVARKQITEQGGQEYARSPRRLTGQAKALMLAVVRRVQRWQRLAYERRLLGSLDQHQLRDIGISRAEAQRESARPFWDDIGQDDQRRNM
ncbi:DUF1127 domain-containing protein [Halopseudomonas pelagia]|uniref:DUF1127 domain-containing protein n=1 Tax=Halopseudomonas pelagia TaxID=553151 RepID=UPI00039A2C16|nr:DUF1127 domain-containing protein [Halopseudomonas pelagia]